MNKITSGSHIQRRSSRRKRRVPAMACCRKVDEGKGEKGSRKLEIRKRGERILGERYVKAGRKFARRKEEEEERKKKKSLGAG